MIQVYKSRHFENALFQYSFASVLAKQWKYRLAPCPIVGFPKTFGTVNGEWFLSPVEIWEGDRPIDAHSRRTLESNEFYIPVSAKLILKSGFRRVELFHAFRDELRNDWLKFDYALPPRPVDDFALCLHVPSNKDLKNENDSGKSKLATSVQEIEEVRGAEIRRLLARANFKRLYIITNEPQHPLITSLKHLNATVIASTGFDRLRLISSFQKLAISQSLLEWWGAFLGRAKEIYYPKANHGNWCSTSDGMSENNSEYSDVDLRVKDEERWIYDW